MRPVAPMFAPDRRVPLVSFYGYLEASGNGMFLSFRSWQFDAAITRRLTEPVASTEAISGPPDSGKSKKGPPPNGLM